MNGGPHLSTALLHSSFGRRLFVLFCLAALIPAATVFWMTYHTATAEVDAWRLRALREGGKDFALGVYTRLQLAEDALAAADADVVEREGRGPFLALYFSDVSVVDRPGPDAATRAGMSAWPPAGSADAAAHLLVSQQVGTASVRLQLPSGGRTLVGTLEPSFLWGDSEEMDQGMRICMFAGGERLFCGGHPGAVEGDRLVTAQWELFLKARFGAPSW